eukprot:TRINITY_DN175_c0_g4_i2.p2 TRINITY_DN175_c0_g4~~TRINITY_DN175_c0_g4_i2.p2  ORF type:complete len:146 (-),score=56.85 TRINITY_DN175_c0_g4_i2:1022-1459(-)
MSKAAAWSKFEEKLKTQGFSFDDVKLSDEDGRKALLVELGITSELEKAAIITEWKNRLQSASASTASTTESSSLNDSTGAASTNLKNSTASQMKRPSKKVGFNAKNQKHEAAEEASAKETAAQSSPPARRPTLEDTKKITKMKVV